MPDNWTYVAAAYVLATVVFGGYWRWLARKEREAGRSRQPSMPGHPRREPGSRAQLQ
jgi:hypothetical protein